MYNYETLSKKQKENVSMADFEIFVNWLEGVKEAGYKTAAFDDTVYQYWFDLEKQEVTKWRKMANKYDDDSGRATNWELPQAWKKKINDFTSTAIYNIVWYDKCEATHGFTMY